jgi:hypothetical protein
MQNLETPEPSAAVGSTQKLGSEHPPGPTDNPVYQAGQAAGSYVRKRPAVGLLVAFGIGFGAGWLLARSSTSTYSTPESRFRAAYDPDHFV